ncbi:Splicing factor [Coemansia sp. IMI 203386]|nr:Splicing factor [Coemansia sp. IMI 203386]
MVSEENELNDLEELQGFMNSLSEKLEKTPYDYSTYVRWIELLRPVGDIGSLRVARERMLQNIAAPNDLWLQWIQDEKCQPEALCNPEALATIKDLYERAATEHMTILMWQKCIEFVKELESSDDSDVRSAAVEAFGSEDHLFAVLQSAVDATSYHFSEGQTIWISYKAYVEQMLENSDGEQREALVELLKAVYLQRLGQPHAQIESTFSMYSGFVTKYMNQDYEQQMIEANSIVSGVRKACAKRVDYETELAASENSWGAFQVYIDKLAKDKTTEAKEINTLYERCLVFHCYTPEIWDEYLTFVAQHADTELLVIANRAVRNCPWSGKIWAQLIHATFAHQGYQAAGTVYERVMSTHAVDYSMAEYAQVAIARVDVARLTFENSEPNAVSVSELDPHELSQVCKSCVSTAYALSIDTADPKLRLERCCTTTAARVSKDTASAREMWTSICKSRRVCAEAWVLSAEFEREYDSVENARNVYRHAAQRKLDNSEHVFDAWITFEHSFGDISTLRAAEGFINGQRHLLWRRMERDSCAAIGGTLQQAAAIADESEEPESSSIRQSKRKRIDASANEDIAKLQPEADSAKCVFVSGLPLTFKKADIDAFFDNIKSTKDIEMLNNKQGEFRGQAKVTVATGEEMIAALDKNGHKVDGSFISVHVFKHRSKEDTQGRSSFPNRARKAVKETMVRVTGFSSETGNKQLEAIAKESGGTVVRVRRNQQGDVAFVTMKSLHDAQNAASALNGRVVQDATLVAAVDRDGAAAPTKELVPQDQKSSIKNALPKTKASNSMVGLVPRKASSSRRPAKRMNIAKPAHAAASASGLASGSTQEKTSTDTPSARTNADFRDLFIGQGDIKDDIK